MSDQPANDFPKTEGANGVPPPATGSDPYETKLRAWCEKHGVRHPDDGEVEELFIEPESDMDDAISQETIPGGKYVDLFDCYGWRERYKIEDLRAHVAKHGKLSTWADFEKLGDLESRDVADDE